MPAAGVCEGKKCRRSRGRVVFGVAGAIMDAAASRAKASHSTCFADCALAAECRRPKKPVAFSLFMIVCVAVIGPANNPLHLQACDVSWGCRLETPTSRGKKVKRCSMSFFPDTAGVRRRGHCPPTILYLALCSGRHR